MKSRIAVVMHFESSSGFSYDKERSYAGRGRPDKSKLWWTKRRKLLKDLVIPSLKRQTFKDFDVWGLFHDKDRSLSYSVRKLLEDAGKGKGKLNVHIGFERDKSIRNHYAGNVDFLVLVHLDSDDMYGPTAIQEISKVDLDRGLVIYFEDGYLYDLNTKKLYDFTPGQHGPGPYFAQVYTNASLKSANNWNKYRRRFGLTALHHQLRHCPNQQILSSGQFCGTIHGSNTSRKIDNPNTRKRIGAEIGGKPRDGIKKLFGLK